MMRAEPSEAKMLALAKAYVVPVAMYTAALLDPKHEVKVDEAYEIVPLMLDVISLQVPRPPRFRPRLSARRRL